MQELQRSDRQELVSLEMTSFAVAAEHSRGVSVEPVDDQFPEMDVLPLLQYFDPMLLDTV